MRRMYRVTITQTNVFYIEAESEDDARAEAIEDHIWDEDQQPPNRYDCFTQVEEMTDG